MKQECREENIDRDCPLSLFFSKELAEIADGNAKERTCTQIKMQINEC